MLSLPSRKHKVTGSIPEGDIKNTSYVLYNLVNYTFEQNNSDVEMRKKKENGKTHFYFTTITKPLLNYLFCSSCFTLTPDNIVRFHGYEFN